MALFVLTGVFFGGWVSNEMRHRYIIKDNATIEVIQVPNVTVIRGTKSDVENISKSINSHDTSTKASGR